MRYLLIISITILFFVLIVVSSFGSVPSIMNYQGKLSNASGQAVTDGTYGFLFEIYDQISGGNQLWTETQDIQVTGGLFTVLLGSVTPLPDTAFQGEAWLQVSVNHEQLGSRIRIASAPSALRAGLAETVPDNSITTDKVADDSITNTKLANDQLSLNKVSGGALSASGNSIGIGTTIPDAPLAIWADQAYGRLTTMYSAWGSVLDLRNLADSPIYLGAINFMDALGGYPGQIGYLGSNDLVFRTNGSEQMRIDSSGNVGIGKTSPTVKLDVNGGVKIGGDVQITGNVTGDLKVTGKILQAGIPAAPIAFGVVDVNGTKVSGTPNWNSSWNSTWQLYQIDLGVNYDSGGYVTIVTPVLPYQQDFPTPWTSSLIGKLYIGFGGIGTQCRFSFITYKP